nr:ribonuclease H-like domain-containing protein [Tanacetum cinerariifolium]
MKPFGYPVTILNTLDHLGKFDGKADEGFFVGYSINSKAFRLFNRRKMIVEENLHIRFSENTPNVVDSGPDWLFDIDALTRTMNYEPIVEGTQSNGFARTKAYDNADISTFNFSSDHENDDEEADINNMDTTIQVSLVPTTRIHKDHPLDQVIRDLHSTTQTRNMLKNFEEHRSKLDRGYAGRASIIQITRSLDSSRFTK